MVTANDDDGSPHSHSSSEESLEEEGLDGLEGALGLESGPSSKTTTSVGLRGSAGLGGWAGLSGARRGMVNGAAPIFPLCVCV